MRVRVRPMTERDTRVVAELAGQLGYLRPRRRSQALRFGIGRSGSAVSSRKTRTAGSSGGRTSSPGSSWSWTRTPSSPAWWSTEARVAREPAGRSCGGRDLGEESRLRDDARALQRQAPRSPAVLRGQGYVIGKSQHVYEKTSSERPDPAVTATEAGKMRAMSWTRRDGRCAPPRSRGRCPARARAPGSQRLRVCRTDLHVMDGELRHPKLPLVPGHEIVGRVAAVRSGGRAFSER